MEEDYTKQEVVDCTFDLYRMCYDKVSELFTDEQAIQSATATLLINASKEYPTTKALQNNLRKKIAEIDKAQAIPNVLEVWYFHYADLIVKYGARMKGMITHCVTERNYSPQELDERIKDYAIRLDNEKQN